MYALTELRPRIAQQCSIRCVEEILNEIANIRKPEYTTFLRKGGYERDFYEEEDFWNEVKKELLNE